MNISVVIPSYNGRALLEKHLPAVLAAVRKGDEVIVVDDASTDGSVEFLRKQFPEVRCIVHGENLRYAQSCNDGVKNAVHDIIVLLNNDVSPKRDFLHPLLGHFDNPEVFAVGCAEVNDSKILSGRSLGVFTRGMLVHRRAEKQDGRTTLWAAGGSMVVRKSLWKEFGGMDTLFKPAYEEDRDLSYRAWKMGYLVEFEPASVVRHEHETTNIQAIGKRDLQTASYKNMFIFFWKNVTDQDLVLQHFVWLPYHLIFGGIRSKGLLVRGFFQALKQFPDVMKKRTELSRQWKLTDAKVMEKVGGE